MMIDERRGLFVGVCVGVCVFVLLVLLESVMFADPPDVDSERGRKNVEELRCKFQVDSFE